MQVHCENTDCKHLNASYLCTRNSVYIDEDGECIDFEHFNTLKEYKEPHYIAVFTADNKKGKALKYGKKIEINGYTFFTRDNYKVFGELSEITEERTGVLCGTIQQVKGMFEKFKEIESKVASCASFPLCEYDEDIKGYIPKKEGAGNG